MLVSEKPPGPNANPRRPNVSRWNIGRVGSPGIGTHGGHVHFMSFCVNFICDGELMQMHFLVEYGLYRHQPLSD